MPHNLFIAYDLMQLGHNYEALRAAIKNLGQWHQFQLSLFYVHTDLTPHQAFASVAAVMDADDRLIVIDTTYGIVTDWDKPPIEAINAIWHQGQVEKR